MGRDGSDQRRLGNLIGASPDWGPSDRIAFQSDRQIAVTDPAGAEVRVITKGEQVSARPSWAPGTSVSQHQELVFESFRDGNWEIYRISEDGTGLTRLTIDPLPDNEPAW